MKNAIKSRLHHMIDEIQDETVLQMVMEDISVYTSGRDITDELSSKQLEELDAAIEEMNEKQGISWDIFKQEMKEWRQK